MWVSEFESAQLGIIKIGTYVTKKEAYEMTDKWLRETTVSDGETETTMLELVNEDFSCDVYVYETDERYVKYDWEEEDD